MMLVFANLVLWVGYRLSADNMKEVWRDLTDLSADSTLYTLERRRNDLRADLKLLASNPDLIRAILYYDELVLNRIASDWELFVSEKRLYDQVRLIDLSGMERLRVDLTSHGASRVSADQLQNKSNRYYFQQGLAIDAGAIYASPIDLNVEQGEVEIPYKPMIRLVAPLDVDGEIKALLVVNALASHIFGDLERHARLVHGGLLLLDESGNYLRGFSRNQEWQFMFPESSTETRQFNESYPDLWAMMQQTPSGQISRPEGIFSFRTVTYGSSGFTHSYRLVVVMTEEQQQALLLPQRNLWLFIALVLTLLLLFAVLVLGRYRSGQLQAKPVVNRKPVDLWHLFR
ncbi:cache domain-containing protein [Candidatus Thiodiazotropha endoloripes]|nr:cache domain-containing protein [Candidatus Thiodiazotropha endoloripes]MCG7903115.1 cache domain-containing protein [Candidatus Thiodiazotropha weberae]